MATIDINDFLFSKTSAEKKLEVIDSLSDITIRKATNATMLKIYNACCGDRDRFYIDTDRRAGNDWNSTIEFLFEYQGNACLMMYVQGGSTDTSDSVRYNEFNRGSSYRGNCHLGSYSYDAKDIANVIRCILKEYIYYTEIEHKEREEREQREKLTHWSIVNPVYNNFYKEWGCKYQGGYPGAPHDRLDRYYRAKKAVEEYVSDHVSKLVGKTDKELQEIYTKIFETTK